MDEEFDRRLATRIQNFSDIPLSGFDPRQVASVVMEARHRRIWHVIATAASAAAAATVAIAAIGLSLSLDGQSSENAIAGASATATVRASAVATPLASEPSARPSQVVPASGLSHEQAIAAARAAVPEAKAWNALVAKSGRAGDVLHPREGPSYNIGSSIPDDQMVWVIVFGSSGEPLTQQGAVVVLDFTSGKLETVVKFTS